MWLLWPREQSGEGSAPDTLVLRNLEPSTSLLAEIQTKAQTTIKLVLLPWAMADRAWVIPNLACESKSQQCDRLLISEPKQTATSATTPYRALLLGGDDDRCTVHVRTTQPSTTFLTVPPVTSDNDLPSTGGNSGAMDGVFSSHQVRVLQCDCSRSCGFLCVVDVDVDVVVVTSFCLVTLIGLREHQCSPPKQCRHCLSIEQVNATEALGPVLPAPTVSLVKPPGPPRTIPKAPTQKAQEPTADVRATVSAMQCCSACSPIPCIEKPPTFANGSRSRVHFICVLVGACGGLVWLGLVWFGWFGLVWFGLVCLCS